MALSRAEIVEAIGELSPEDLRAIAKHFADMFGIDLSLPQTGAVPGAGLGQAQEAQE